MSLTQTFNDKLETYIKQFPNILDDFKHNYVLYNKNPDYNEYLQVYSSSKSNLDTINKNISDLNNDIISEINNLNNKITNLDNDIKIQKDNYENIKKILTQVNGTNNGSFELIHNTSELYKKQLLLNTNLGIGIFLLIWAMIKLYR